MLWGYGGTGGVAARLVVVGLVLLAIGGWGSVDIVRLKLFGEEATATVTGYRRMTDTAGHRKNGNTRYVTYDWDHHGEKRMGYDVVAIDWSPPANGEIAIRYLPNAMQAGKTTKSRLQENSRNFPPLLMLSGLLLAAVGVVLWYRSGVGNPP